MEARPNATLWSTGALECFWIGLKRRTTQASRVTKVEHHNPSNRLATIHQRLLWMERCCWSITFRYIWSAAHGQWDR